MNDIEKFRIRWKRWLGQKCRKDKPYWATLLNTNWSGWAKKVLEKNEVNEVVVPSDFDPRKTIKKVFSEAIGLADMSDLLKLDNLYVIEKLGL